MYMRMKSFLLIFSNIFHRISLFAQRKPVRFYIVCVSILNDAFDNVSLVRGIVERDRHAGTSEPHLSQSSPPGDATFFRVLGSLFIIAPVKDTFDSSTW